MAVALSNREQAVTNVPAKGMQHMNSLSERQFELSPLPKGFVSETGDGLDQSECKPLASERRRGKRYAIQAPAVARIGTREIWAFTKNVSSCGALFIMSADEELPDVGNTLELMIRVPQTISSARPCFIHGRGKIVRSEQRQWDEVGIAVDVLDFAIEREAGG